MISGYRRAWGGLGARNHVFVLPSVVCSGLAARSIAAGEAISVPHQHGCAHVGDDSQHTEDVFVGVSTNPNVAATVVVSLGCETIQGKRVARLIQERGQRVEFVGIQAEGGTARTVSKGRDYVRALRLEAARMQRVDAPLCDLSIAVDSAEAPFLPALLDQASKVGTRVVVAEGQPGPEQHPDLAAAGSQVIVSWCAEGEAPVGFAVCPVIAVGGDGDLYEAIEDDFDLDGSGGDPEAVAAAVFRLAVQVFNGRQTASERRGARDFLLRRLVRTM